MEGGKQFAGFITVWKTAGFFLFCCLKCISSLSVLVYFGQTGDAFLKCEKHLLHKLVVSVTLAMCSLGSWVYLGLSDQTAMQTTYSHHFKICLCSTCILMCELCCCSEFQIREQSHRNTLSSSIYPGQVPCPVPPFSSPPRSLRWQLSLFHHMRKFQQTGIVSSERLCF